MCRSAGSVLLSGPVEERRTRICENSGAQRVIGSLNANRPSSNNISASVDVIGFVIEAMRNNVFLSIGSLSSMSSSLPPQSLLSDHPAKPVSLRQQDCQHRQVY